MVCSTPQEPNTVKLDVDVCYPNRQEDDSSSSTNEQPSFARVSSSLHVYSLTQFKIIIGVFIGAAKFSGLFYKLVQLNEPC